jgi:YqaJ-like recombinase protein
MKIVPGRQLSSAWLYAHRGVVSGSYMNHVLDFTKERTLKSGEKRGGDPGSKRLTYLRLKIAELLTSRVESDNYVSKEMLEGLEREPMARAAYELKTGQMVEQIGFALHDGIERFGGSVDGLVGTDGIIEIKCAKPGTHQAWIRDKCIPPEHIPQIAAYLSITGRKWCDFVAYCPLMPKPLQMMVMRHERSEEQIAALEYMVIDFNEQVDKAIAELREIVGPFDLPAAMEQEIEREDPINDGLGLSDADIQWAERGFKD